MPIRILVVDDSQIFRRVLCQLLEQHAELEIVGQAASFAELNQMASDLKPEIIITDLYMPDLNSLGLQPRIEAGTARVIAISIFNGAEAEELAANLGAVVLLDKANLYSELVPAIRQATK